MKLLLPEIREEAFEVKTSIKNIKKSHDFQLKLAKLSEEAISSDLTFEELTKANVLADSNTIDLAEKFISDILGLNKKEVEKLEDFERFEFNNIQSKIILAMQGYSDDDIDKMFEEEAEEDPKKEQALKTE